jgi:signal transduction histidine kinase
MRVQLISEDREVARLCGEILHEFPSQTCRLVTGERAEPDHDVWIWDYRAGFELPDDMDWAPSKHLFLVHRKEIAEFRKASPHPGAAIVLKPVTRASLAAFLTHAVSVHGRHASTDDSLRADRDELLQCLIEANLKLQEYDQERTNFVARGIHDFRAPLTAINGYCGLLVSEALGPLGAEQKEVLQRMQHSSNRLWRMASAMFDLSVGRQGKTRVETQKRDIQDCVNQALHEIGAAAEGKQIAITVQLERELRELPIDAAPIEQLLINILENACRFTPKYGEIDIQGYPYFWERRRMKTAVPPAGERRHRQSGQFNAYRIDIRNTGSLISPQHLLSIFEEYTSYSGGEDRSGGGLGLAICRLVAQQHEGCIWAENTDRGPRFSLVLPSLPRLLADLHDSASEDSARTAPLAEVV